MKKYLFGIIILMGITILMMYQAMSDAQEKKFVAEQNIVALTSKVESYKIEKNQLVYKIRGLELSERTFKQLFDSLFIEASHLKLRLNNAQSVTKIVTKIEYKNKDSIIYVPVLDSVNSAKKYIISEPFIKAEVITSNDSIILPGNFKIIDIPNQQLSVPVIEYKGWWWWKKPKSVTIHITNTNPYITVTDGIFIDLSRK